ncbi:MAG: CBS domain-containing protein [Chloroflexi bacterium]|nr:CBS domain-containing protein [Chloroflexota bacterium]
MFIRDVMTTNVVTIPSTTSLADARRIMDAHHIRRLPVVDKGKVLGVVSRDALDKAGPSKLTTFSIHEVTYLLGKITVREIMSKNLVSVSPDATVEEAVAMAQSKKVGMLIVIEDGRLVGIATTNDFFYKIANPILGIDKPGTRFSVHNWRSIADLQKILGIIDRFQSQIVTMYTMTHPESGQNDFVAHLTTSNPDGLMEELRKNGYEVHERAR